MPRASVRTAVGMRNFPRVMDGNCLVWPRLSTGKILVRAVFNSFGLMLPDVRPFLRSPASSSVSPFHRFPAPNFILGLRMRVDAPAHHDSTPVLKQRPLEV